MSEPLDAIVPSAILAALDDDQLERSVGLTFLLMTVCDDGWPHAALLSVGEFVADGTDRVAIALWPHSTATANLRDRGRATLNAVLDGTSYVLRVATAPIGEVKTPHGPLAGFAGSVVAASADRVAYATLECGVRFQLRDPARTLERWAATRVALRRLVQDVRGGG